MKSERLKLQRKFLAPFLIALIIAIAEFVIIMGIHKVDKCTDWIELAEGNTVVVSDDTDTILVGRNTRNEVVIYMNGEKIK